MLGLPTLFVKSQVAMQGFRHRGSEEGRDAKHAYDHVIRMPDERLPKKVFYGELHE